MAKKIFTLLVIILGGVFFSLHAQNRIEESLSLNLQIHYFDPTLSSGDGTRTPILIPYVNQDGHTLYLYDANSNYTLVLLDEDGEVVYITPVSVGDPIIILPNTLTGNYVLQLYPGTYYYFEGVIEL
jgi:hypothetical protein